MIKRWFFFPIVAMLLAAGWLLARNSSDESTSSGTFTPEFLASITHQATHERSWQPQPATKVLTLESGEVDLFGTFVVKIDSRGDIYVLDYGDFLIKRFTADGHFVRSYGEGRGQGPGEFAFPTDFSFASDDQLWVADATNGRLLRFNQVGQPPHTVNVQQRPYRVIPGHGKGPFVMVSLVHANLFARIDEEGHVTEKFGTFLVDQQQTAKLLDGWIEPLPNGGFVYASLYAGLLIRYDADGTVVFATETINRQALPKIVRNSQGRTWIDREAFRTTLDLSVSERGIHLFAYIEEGLRKVGAIDTYSIEDGRYQYSHRLPEPTANVVVTADHIYTVQKTSISKWRLEFTES